MSFANNFGRGLVAAMEEEAQLGEGDPTAELPAVDSAESALIESNDAAATIEAGTSEIEQTQADSETLSDIADTMEASEADGGADPVAAEIAEVAVEAIYARLGIKAKSIGVEAFGDKANRVRSTRIAIENIREQVSKIWKAIVNAFNKVIEWVKSFIDALFDGNQRLLQRADALEKKLNGAKGTPKAGAKITGSLVKALASTAGSSKKTALPFIDAGPQITEGLSIVTEILKVSDIEIKDVVQNKAKFDAFSVSPVKFAGGKKSSESAPEGMQWLDLGKHELPGNKRLAVCVPASQIKGADAWAALGKYAVRVVTANAKLDLKDSFLEPLTIEEAKHVVGKSRDTVKSVIAAKNETESIKHLLTDIVTKARSAATLGNEEDKEIPGRSRAVQGGLTASVNMSVKTSVTLLKEGTALAKAGLDYVEASLKEYGEEADTKKAEDKK